MGHSLNGQGDRIDHKGPKTDIKKIYINSNTNTT